MSVAPLYKLAHPDPNLVRMQRYQLAAPITEVHQVAAQARGAILLHSANIVQNRS